MIPVFVVDAFSDEPFHGNPAAVCVLPAGPWPDDGWLQSVATEMRHSETAFVRPRDDADGADRDLRWFTPEVEVDLCGHATLATAHVLWTEGVASPEPDPLCFHTRSGPLRARRVAGRTQLDFPVLVSTTVDPAAEPDLHHRVRDALGAEPVVLARNVHDLLVEVADARTVRALDPDLATLAAIEARGVLVTATSDDAGFDFVSRFFAPRVGVDEDPVTGSAHCALAPYWAARIGRNDLVGHQVSARGGTVHCTLVTEGDEGQRVLLAGSAVTVWRGTLVV